MKRTTHPARLSLLALAAGGILVTVGHALSTPIEGTGQEYVARFTANRPEHVAGLLLTTIGALLFLPGVGGVLRVLDGRSRLARVGGTLGAIGAAALAMRSVARGLPSVQFACCWAGPVVERSR